MIHGGFVNLVESVFGLKSGLLEQVSRWRFEGWIIVVVALDNEIGSRRCDGDAAGDGG